MFLNTDGRPPACLHGYLHGDLAGDSRGEGKELHITPLNSVPPPLPSCNWVPSTTVQETVVLVRGEHLILIFCQRLLCSQYVHQQNKLTLVLWPIQSQHHTGPRKFPLGPNSLRRTDLEDVGYAIRGTQSLTQFTADEKQKHPT